MQKAAGPDEELSATWLPTSPVLVGSAGARALVRGYWSCRRGLTIQSSHPVLIRGSRICCRDGALGEDACRGL